MDRFIGAHCAQEGYSRVFVGIPEITPVEVLTDKPAGNPVAPKLVGVFVAVIADGSIRVAVTGAGPCVFRATSIEAALARNFTAEAAESASVPADGLNSDIHRSAEFRAHLVPVLAGRAVVAAG